MLRRLVGSEMCIRDRFYALAADAKNFAEARDEMLDQRRLADPGFTRNPYDLALTCAREIPVGTQSQKCMGTPDKRCGLRRRVFGNGAGRHGDDCTGSVSYTH